MSLAEMPRESPADQRQPGRGLASCEGTGGPGPQGCRELLAPAGDGDRPCKLHPGLSAYLGDLGSQATLPPGHTSRWSEARMKDAVGSLSVCSPSQQSRQTLEKGLSLTGELCASARRVCSRPGWTEGISPGLFNKKMHLSYSAKAQADKRYFFQRQGSVFLTLESLGWLTHKAETPRPAEPKQRPESRWRFHARPQWSPGPCQVKLWLQREGLRGLCPVNPAGWWRHRRLKQN